ncbi:MAG: DALR domain-containing protein, partial [Miltoncostaeaceae bacterium]
LVARLGNALRALDVAAEGDGVQADLELARAVAGGRGRFFDALADDFGTPGAFAALFEIVRAANRALGAGTAGAGQARETALQLRELLDVLGLGAIGTPADAATAGPPAEVTTLAEARRDARAARDFAEADRLRDAIAAAGWRVTDTPEGFRLDRA